MQALTPLVEPLSLDEAYLDLSGTDRIHGMSPARTMAKLAREIERDIGITVSIGLSSNKFPAKLASEMDKPRGLAVIGMKNAVAFLRDKKVGVIRSAGKVLEAQLNRDGFVTIGDLQDADQRDSGQPLRRHRPLAGAHRLGRGQPRGRSGRRDEVDLVGNHFQHGICRPIPSWRRCCGGRPSGSPPAPRPSRWPAAPWC